mgnify:CR=1 FL=1
MPRATIAGRSAVEVTPKPAAAEPAILIGTPETIPALFRQLEAAPGLVAPVGCLALGPDGSPIGGAPGLGRVEGLDALARARDSLGARVAVVSLPSSMWSLARRIRAELARAGIAERFVPPLAELLTRAPAPTPGGPCGAPVLDYAALIGREPHAIDHDRVGGLIEGRRVLITGAGGSIGSELARVVALYRPSLIVLMERSENALFEVDRRLGERFSSVPRRAVLHDVAEAESTRRLVADLAPDVVFHAAAHKHVPLMEDHPAHAITNNLLGTRAIADAAADAGTRQFVMVSTDKAVNPTSVMGATKRLAELYVADLHARVRRGARPGAAPTCYSMVRFGNVLGSACSVLTIWAAQLAEGGPLTVTDPRMTRYFMTIPEAAALVAQAAAMSDPASDRAGVFVLDMGRPVRILDLAERFLRAHGVEPRLIEDETCETPLPPDALPAVGIRCTGVRPGEKLHEELAYSTEDLAPTDHPGIMAWSGGSGTPIDITDAVERLARVRSGAERLAVLDALRRYIPTLAAPIPCYRKAV